MNGDCVVGAMNKTDIKNLQREQDELKEDVKEVKGELKAQKNLLIATLVGVVINLLYMMLGRWAG